MSEWSGWVGDIISAIGAPNSGEVRKFLNDWATQEPSNCRNNPLLASHGSTGSSPCKKLSSGLTSRNYTSPARATVATRQQLESGAYPELLKALRSGAPYHVTDKQTITIVNELKAWGVLAFAGFFNLTTAIPPGSGSPKPGAGAPRGHAGFHDLQKALARTLPTSLRRSRIIRQRALRKLGAPRRLG